MLIYYLGFGCIHGGKLGLDKTPGRDHGTSWHNLIRHKDQKALRYATVAYASTMIKDRKALHYIVMSISDSSAYTFIHLTERRLECESGRKPEHPEEKRVHLKAHTCGFAGVDPVRIGNASYGKYIRSQKETP